MEVEEMFDGFMKIVAVAYLSVLFGWIGKELIKGFIIGWGERKEFKERERAWGTDINYAAGKESSKVELTEKAAAQALKKIAE